MIITLLKFLIDLAVNIISFLVLARFLLQCVKANFFHPMIQILVRITNPIILPIRRITPVFSSWDWSCIIVVAIISILRYSLFMLLDRSPISPLTVIILTSVSILQDILSIYIYAIIGVAICSWFRDSPNARVILDVLGKLTYPLMKQLKFSIVYRNIDFKPMIVIFILLLLQSGLLIIKNFLLGLGT